MKTLKWILIAGFVVSFALPFTGGAYGFHVFYFTPGEVLHAVKQFFRGITGESLFLTAFGEGSISPFPYPWATAETWALGIVWVSNFTAFFLNRKRLIYFILAAHIVFLGLLFFIRMEMKWRHFPPCYLVWAPCVVGLHLLRLSGKPAAESREKQLDVILGEKRAA